MHPHNDKFIEDRPEQLPPKWRPFIVKKLEWQEGLQARALRAADAYARYEILIRHPDSESTIGGLAPGIEVRFGTLAPGQCTLPRRTNASEFSILLEGEAEIQADGKTYNLKPRDTWVVPAMRPSCMRNSGRSSMVYITYSNAALLKLMRVFYEEASRDTAASFAEGLHGFARARDIAGPGHTLNESGAHLLPYEYLVDPDSIESRVLVWHWPEVQKHLPSLLEIDPHYDGRTLWVLYNPATERRVGTTPSFFASMACIRPHSNTDSHRHVSAAINLILEGAGYSMVNGERMDWEAGDIMLSAPGWMPHSHHTGEQISMVLTVQDHPMHIATESLIWQEHLPAGAIINLGTQSGFSTNRASLATSEQ